MFVASADPPLLRLQLILFINRLSLPWTNKQHSSYRHTNSKNPRRWVVSVCVCLLGRYLPSPLVTGCDGGGGGRSWDPVTGGRLSHQTRTHTHINTHGCIDTVAFLHWTRKHSQQHILDALFFLCIKVPLEQWHNYYSNWFIYLNEVDFFRKILVWMSFVL